MIRRVHLPRLTPGRVDLPAPQAHHVRDVLRLDVGAELELFDDAGHTSLARITHCSADLVRVEVTEIREPVRQAVELTIAAAIPKGARADWMIEKLSELGVATFIPLRAERSVVVPQGRNKLDRWARLGEQAARQSGRTGVMRIESPLALEQVLSQDRGAGARTWHLSTADEAAPLAGPAIPARLMLLVGPEGGWSPAELELFQRRNVPAASLTSTVLRVETAAVAAAAVVLCRRRDDEAQPP